MTQALELPTKQIFFMSDGFGIKPKVYGGNGSNKVYKGVAVFRSGTFRDSAGIQATYEDIQLKQMVDNYNYLRNKNILPSVPVRDGHPGFIMNNVPGKGAVIGWHQNLTTKAMKSPVDGQEYTYLLVDYEITEPYALEKIANGTWRNRSAEIGDYTTNNESEFWPVYMGFAFVDFPAVEGLNFSSSQGKFYAYLGGIKENQVTHPSQGTGGTPQFTLPVMPPVAPAAPQQQVAPIAPAAPVAPASAFVFSVGGQNVSDFNQVQAYIRQLETFAAETRASGRRNFVAQLVTDKKMTAPQQAAQEQFALTLTDEQFDAWKAGWEASAPLSILGNHGGTVSNPSNGAQPDANAQALADAEAIVKMHERGGMMTTAQIKATSSYQKLVAAGTRQA